jgi:hypothetical protein
MDIKSVFKRPDFIEDEAFKDLLDKMSTSQKSNFLQMRQR